MTGLPLFWTLAMPAPRKSGGGPPSWHRVGVGTQLWSWGKKLSGLLGPSELNQARG